MIYEYTINGRRLKSGDIISTKDGRNSIYSIGFRLLGAIIPGEVDHTVIYVGPDGHCVESGIRGVIAFETGHMWGSDDDLTRRGLIDTFYAASSVFPRDGFSPEEEDKVRISVREYVLGCVGKEYNINFSDPNDEQKIYCSQLVYLAYKKTGIDLNVGTFGIPGIDNIIFPQEIFDHTNLMQAV